MTHSDFITMTPAQLEHAFLLWRADHEAGLCLGHAAADALPAAQHAAASAEALQHYLARAKALA